MSGKQKSVYICQNCGYESAKWLGKCPECGNWSSFEQEVRKTEVKKSPALKKSDKLVKLLETPAESQQRFSSGIDELDRTLGGGIVPGSVIMIGGDPGIGKSTLMLQMLNEITSLSTSLYISGEESDSQVNLRARRLNIKNDHILFSSETSLQNLLQDFDTVKPQLIIIDSIQTIYHEQIDSIPGNISQLRTCTSELLRYAKSNNVPIVLIGHVTKEGSIAGPKVLEHMVDTVLYFEGDNHYDYRILRSVKNRFGPVNEIGLFRMSEEGLLGVKNPSEIFLSANYPPQSGNAIVAVMEGNRSFLVQIQALVTKTQFGLPQRTATGIDHRRMNLLLAVLEKRCAKPFGFYDVFVKVAGGLRVDEPAADLGICMALLSSFDDRILPVGTVYIGEVGLGGEIRNVRRLTDRIMEAHKLGFQTIVVPRLTKSTGKLEKAKIKEVEHLSELI
jgi:DNA repair protein RadA/Sms